MPTTPPPPSTTTASGAAGIGNSGNVPDISNPGAVFGPDGQVTEGGGVVSVDTNVSSFGSDSVASINDPSSLSRGVSGVTSQFRSASIRLQPTNSPFPDVNQLKMALERYLPKITEKKGIGNFSLFDGATGKRVYRTANFFLNDVSFDISDAVSIVKTNRGFTIYSPDAQPMMVGVTGQLLAGDDWVESETPLAITHTDWFSKFLSDYAQRLRSSKTQFNNQQLYFSFNDFYAQVEFISLRLRYSSSAQLLSGFNGQLVVKEAQVEYRPDLAGSGPDPETDDERNARLREQTNRDIRQYQVQYQNGNTSSVSCDGTPLPATIGWTSPVPWAVGDTAASAADQAASTAALNNAMSESQSSGS